eukprot:5610417-Pyramimonas_sp.AAC.1
MEIAAWCFDGSGFGPREGPWPAPKTLAHVMGRERAEPAFPRRGIARATRAARPSGRAKRGRHRGRSSCIVATVGRT